jgi:hypothetical protein
MTSVSFIHGAAGHNWPTVTDGVVTSLGVCGRTVSK